MGVLTSLEKRQLAKIPTTPEQAEMILLRNQGLLSQIETLIQLKDAAKRLYDAEPDAKARLSVADIISKLVAWFIGCSKYVPYGCCHCMDAANRCGGRTSGAIYENECNKCAWKVRRLVRQAAFESETGYYCTFQSFGGFTLCDVDSIISLSRDQARIDNFAKDFVTCDLNVIDYLEQYLVPAKTFVEGHIEWAQSILGKKGKKK
jgi:hypothetical protein